jgi:protocatechuate 3,4-dioxygenase beta subunit
MSLSRILGLVSLLLVAASETRAQRGVPATASIEGTVLDAATGQPIAGVRIHTGRGGRGQTVTTDSAGRFRMEALAAGTHQLRTEKEGYAPARPEGRTAPGNSAIPIEVADGQRVTNVVVRLSRGSVVSGRVVQPNGEPFLEARVSVARRSYGQLGQESVESHGNSTTNDRGEFRISNLDPGQYYIAIDGPRTLSSSALTAQIYSTLYYPGTADASRAEPITVGLGEELRVRDVLLATVKSVPVRVQILNDTGSPVGEHRTMRAGLRDATNFMTTTTLSRVMGGPDALEIAGLAPGLNVVSVGWDIPDGYAFGTTTFNVAGTEGKLNIDLTVRKGVHVTVDASLQGADGTLSPLPGIDVVLQSTLGVSLTVARVTGADGTFSLASVQPSEYRLTLAGLPQGAYWVRAEQLGRNLLSGTALVSGDTRIDLVAAMGAATITGSVKNGAGKLVPGAMVALLPALSARDRNDLYRRTTSNQNGEFTFTGMTPGTYKLFSWADADGSAPFRNAEFMKPYEDKGTEIRVEKGQRSTTEIIPLDLARP